MDSVFDWFFVETAKHYVNETNEHKLNENSFKPKLEYLHRK